MNKEQEDIKAKCEACAIGKCVEAVPYITGMNSIRWVIDAERGDLGVIQFERCGKLWKRVAP